MDTFDLIYKKYKDDVYRYHMKQTAYSPQLSEELTQETFFQAYRSIGKFKGDSHIKTWLIGISKNVYRTYVRKNKDYPQAYDQMARTPDISRMEDVLEKDQMLALSKKIIETFPSRMYLVMSYRLFEERSYSDICHELKISMSSAKVLFHRGKVKLKSELKEVYGYEI